jgi:hypothetical protein
MTNQTVNFLRTFNRWRRGDEGLSQPCPRVVGQMIDDACDQIERLERERDQRGQINDRLDLEAKQ